MVPTGILRLPWLRFSRAFSSVVRQIPGYTSQGRGTARTLPNSWTVLFYVLFLSTVLFCVLFVCKCVLYYCHRVSTQLQLNISYTSFVSRKLHLPETAPGTHDRWQVGRDKKAESLHLPGIKPQSPAIQSAIQSLYWLGYQGSYTGCARHSTTGNMLISNNRILELTIWYVQSVFLLPRTLPYRLQLSGTSQNSWTYYLIRSKCLPPTTHIATLSTTFRRVCTYCLTQRTKLSLFYGLSVAEHPSVWRLLRHLVYVERNKVFTFAFRTPKKTFNPSKYQGNRMVQVLGNVPLSTR
jgi:hypothetical protein